MATWNHKHILSHIGHAVLALIAASLIDAAVALGASWLGKQNQATEIYECLNTNSNDVTRCLNSLDRLFITFGNDNPLVYSLIRCVGANPGDNFACRRQIDDLRALAEKDEWLEQQQKCYLFLQRLDSSVKEFSRIVMNEDKRRHKFYDLIEGYIAMNSECMRFNEDADYRSRWLSMGQNDLQAQLEMRLYDWQRKRADVIRAWESNPSAETWASVKLELEQAGMLPPPAAPHRAQEALEVTSPALTPPIAPQPLPPSQLVVQSPPMRLPPEPLAESSPIPIAPVAPTQCRQRFLLRPKTS